MKAILVIDEMPNNNAELFKAIFGIYSEEFWSFSEEQMLDFINRRPSWCPLKPMPKAKRLDTKDMIANTENVGWNACLEKVFGNDE